MKALEGKVCLVTGATRGLGKGIALQLGEAGATVYITGRTLVSKDSVGGIGCLQDTADEIKSRGGVCIPVQCDHTKDEDVDRLFEKIKQEQSGQLDVLINNAFSAVQIISNGLDKKFWEHPYTMWDEVNNVGLRNHYICTVLAARLMVERKQGLIVNISSPGGLGYFFENVPYGVGKEALDRMAVDCAIEMRDSNVACVSLWPGGVTTENVLEMAKETKKHSLYAKVAALFDNGETPEYTGRAVMFLATDSKIMKKSGRVILVADLADEYGFRDVDGSQPLNLRSIGSQLIIYGPSMFVGMAKCIPRWLKVPRWIVAMAGNKFY